MHRATVGNFQQALTLRRIKLSMQAYAPGYAFDMVIAINAILGMNSLVQQTDFDIVKRQFFKIGIHA